MTRTALPQRRPSQRRKRTYAGAAYYVDVGYYHDGRPGDVFCDGAKQGSEMQAVLADSCVLISLLLQYGATVEEIGHSLGRVPRWTDGQEAEGPASVIGMIVETIGRAEA